MTRDQLKSAAAHLAARFDTMPDDLWSEAMEMSGEIEISCVVGAKQIVLIIRNSETES